MFPQAPRLRLATMKTLNLAPLLFLALSACHHSVANAATAGAEPTGISAVPFNVPKEVRPAAPKAQASFATVDLPTLVARVQPAVVNITTVHEVKAPRMPEFPFGFEFFGQSPFGGAPRGRRMPGNEDQVLRQQALGTGFLVNSGGRVVVVTNAHVVAEATIVKVKLADEREYTANVKGRDESLDIAFLELKDAPKDLPSVQLGSSEELRVGEDVFAIGNPFGLGHTVTRGIVSAKSRSIGAGLYDDFIQTDASINPGNSGGPLFDLNGVVIGINTAINPNGKGIGFAIPVDVLKDVAPQLLNTGKISRGRLGVAIQAVDPSLAKTLGLDRARGALINEIEPGAAADRAGLHSGDVIVAVDDRKVDHVHDLPRMIARHTPGTKVKAAIIREKKPQTIEVTLDKLKTDDSDESAETDSKATPAKAPSGAIGVEMAEAAGPSGGALVQRVMRGGAADGALRPGDLIIEVNNAKTQHAADVIKRLQSSPPSDAVLIKLRREGRTLYVGIDRSAK